MNGKIFDTHAHYDDDKFAENRFSVIETLFSEGNVGCFVNVGTNEKTNELSKMLAEKYKDVYCAFGFHPHDVSDIEDEDKAIKKLDEMLNYNKCVALGEIGLDYYYDKDYAELQKHYFKEQMKLAQKHSLPVIIHDREAHGDTMDIIREFPDVKGILHGFSGSAEMATELVKRGWYISFSGVITFKNAKKITEVVKSVPLSNMLLETDAPYLAPEPRRGTVNISSNIAFTAAKAAELKGVETEYLLDICYENALKCYNIH